ncbi:MAG: hypothetical protein J6V53_00360 [Alphaproteobacteria bacterium]|nr:hypothetical protein [Alphaproteobacteria bacterium]
MGWCKGGVQERGWCGGAVSFWEKEGCREGKERGAECGVGREEKEGRWEGERKGCGVWCWAGRKRGDDVKKKLEVYGQIWNK